MQKLWLFWVFLVASPLFADSKLDRAESLVLETRYDEALSILNEAEENNPRYYYNRLLCEYVLYKKDEAAKSAKALLSFDDIPLRYRDIGEKIQYDLENIKEDSLHHVASLMKDSQRRLNLGNGGRKVQKVQAETIAILDYLIEKIEQQEGGGLASSNCPSEQKSAPNKTNESSQNAKDSNIKGNIAPGEVDPSHHANAGGWGSLPPKEQAKAKQYADKNYPPHYKKIIEAYNKKIAERKRQ